MNGWSRLYRWGLTRFDRVLAEVHQATLTGGPVPVRPRALISALWPGSVGMASTQTGAPALPDRAAARRLAGPSAPGDDEWGDAEPATSVLLDLRRPAHLVCV